MVIRVLCYLISVSVLCTTAEAEAGIDFRIDVVNDTVWIGEPIVVKCNLYNSENDKINIYARTYAALFCYGNLHFSMNIHGRNKAYEYEVYLHTVSIGEPPFIQLDPQDFVYFYAVLCWSGNYGGFQSTADADYDYLNYDELSDGFYSLQAKYTLADTNIVSNVDSFYGNRMPKNERENNDKISELVDRFFGWPDNIGIDGYQEIHKLFPELCNKEESKLAYYCHYILCRVSFNKGPNALILVNSFLERYPNTPLAEVLMFDLYQYYECQNDQVKAESVVTEAMRKYPNNINGYVYLGLSEKGENGR